MGKIIKFEGNTQTVSQRPGTRPGQSSQTMGKIIKFERTYKALSIRQPYADWICNPQRFIDAHIPIKCIENRDWESRNKGIMLIHAGVKFEAGALEHWARVFPGLEKIVPSSREGYPLGAIVGIADMVGCVEDSEDEWFVGDYGFVLRNARLLTQPIPYKGRLGFFPVPGSLITPYL